MAEAYLPNANDVKLLQWVINEVRNALRNDPRLEEGDRTTSSTDCYIAKVPAAGIPALQIANPDIPGDAECEIYKIVMNGSSYELQYTGFNKTIFNLSLSPIESRYISVTKDKFGKWVADGLETEDVGTGTDVEGTGSFGCPQIPGIVLADLASVRDPDYIAGWKDNCLVKVPTSPCSGTA